MTDTNMTIEKFWDEVHRIARVEGWRIGQAAFNLLRETRPDLAERIMGTGLDPFNWAWAGPDARWTSFVMFVNENWTGEVEPPSEHSIRLGRSVNSLFLFGNPVTYRVQKGPEGGSKISGHDIGQPEKIHCVTCGEEIPIGGESFHRDVPFSGSLFDDVVACSGVPDGTPEPPIARASREDDLPEDDGYDPDEYGEDDGYDPDW